MGPTKVIAKGDALYDVQSGKLVTDGLPTRTAQEEYAKRHYIALPVIDHAGRSWLFEGHRVYCLRGTRYETVTDEVIHVARCLDCGGMGVSVDEVTVERDCIRCTQCGHEFGARLEMMES